MVTMRIEMILAMMMAPNDHKICDYYYRNYISYKYRVVIIGMVMVFPHSLSLSHLFILHLFLSMSIFKSVYLLYIYLHIYNKATIACGILIISPSDFRLLAIYHSIAHFLKLLLYVNSFRTKLHVSIY